MGPAAIRKPPLYLGYPKSLLVTSCQHSLITSNQIFISPPHAILPAATDLKRHRGSTAASRPCVQFLGNADPSRSIHGGQLPPPYRKYDPGPRQPLPDSIQRQHLFAYTAQNLSLADPNECAGSGVHRQAGGGM